VFFVQSGLAYALADSPTLPFFLVPNVIGDFQGSVAEIFVKKAKQ